MHLTGFKLIEMCYYIKQDLVSGVVVVESPGDVKYEGLILQMEGSVNLQLSSKNVGIFEAFTNSVKVCYIYLYINFYLVYAISID